MFSGFAPGQVRVEFAAPGTTYIASLALRNGNRLLVGSAKDHMVVSSAGTNPFTNTAIPGLPAAAAVDPAGNVWIAGSTSADDFPLVNPIYNQKPQGKEAGFLLELGAAGNGLLFSTYLGGSPDLSAPGGTYVAALAFDPAGNVYVGGSTDQAGFPTMAGSTCTPYVDSFRDTTTCSFLVKIGANGKLIYSVTQTASGGCTGTVSGCIGRSDSFGSVNSIAADATGTATVAIATGPTINLRTAEWAAGSTFAARIAPDGSRWTPIYPPQFDSADSLFIATDADGNAVILGNYPKQAASSGNPASSGFFIAQMRMDGSGFNYSFDQGTGLALGLFADVRHNLFVAGQSTASSSPGAAPGVAPLGSGFVSQLDSSGRLMPATVRFPAGFVGTVPNLDASGNLLLLTANNGLLSMPMDARQTNAAAILTFGNAANLVPNAGISPGTLLSILGFNFPADAADLQVLVDGKPAPILFASPTQINIQVPFESAGASTALLEIVSSQSSVSLQAPTSRSIGLFTTDSVHAAALNQDGSVNSASNPAPAGSVVSLFGTGVVWPAGMVEGATAQSATPLSPLLNHLYPNSPYDSITYAGAAPGLINGVFQVNVKIPTGYFATAPMHAIALTDSAASTYVGSNTIYVYSK